jgi:hypothetical protein
LLVEAEPVGDRCRLSAGGDLELGQLSRMRLSALACELVGEFGSGADSQLAVDARQVCLHGLGAHEQLARDLPVGAPGCDQFSDSGFRRGDAAHTDGCAGRSPIRPSSALVAWAHSGAGLGR